MTKSKLYIPSGIRAWALAALLMLCGPTWAGSHLNEVGSVLIYPMIVAGETTETFVTVTNASSTGVTLHVSYINGDAGATDYCSECDFDMQLTGFDTETLSITEVAPGVVGIEGLDNGPSISCTYPYGMLIIDLRDGDGEQRTDNILLGEQVVVDYASGEAFSIPAVPFQGRNGGDGDHYLAFDDQEYGKLPRIVAGDFIAPDYPGDGTGISAELVLFTPGFERRFPPLVDCSVTGFDAYENPFSASVQFGCWTMVSLCDLSPEFCYPYLGVAGSEDQHGWFSLNCRVDQDPQLANGFDANGGVHGAIVQSVASGSVIHREEVAGAAVGARSTWARLLYQSVTTGDPVELRLGAPAGPLF